MDLLQIREQNPEYDDLSDRDIAEGIWQKDYQDISFESFAKAIGFDTNKDNARASYKATERLNPDKEAEGQKISNNLGIPRQVVRENESLYKKKSDEPDFNSMSQNNPGTTKYLSDPSNTSISRDDHNELSNVENEYYKSGRVDDPGLFKTAVDKILETISPENVTDLAIKTGFALSESEPFQTFAIEPAEAIASFLPRAAYTLGRAGTNATAFSAGILAEAAQALENVTGLKKGGLFDWLQDWALRESEAQGQVLQGDDDFLGFNLGLSEDIKGLRLIENPQLIANPEWLIQNTGDALSSMLPIFATAFATGGSTAVAGLVGGLQEGTALFSEMIKEDNVSRATALNASISFGTVSAYLNRIGLDAILDNASVKTLKARIFKSFIKGGVEAATEWAEEPVQALIKALAEEKAPQEVIDQVIEGARNIDVIPGAFLLGGGTSFISQKKEFENFETQKENAAAFKDLHTRVGTAMDQSKTKERSSENSEKFLNILGLGETGFISADGAQILFQESPEVVTEIMEKLGVNPEEAIEEIRSGHDIPVNMSVVHARLSEEERNFIIDDLKPAPGAMSKRQVDEIDIEGSLADIADRFSDAIEDEKGFQTELTRIKNEATKAGVLPEQVEEFGTLVERFSERLELEGQARVDTVSRINIQGKSVDDFEAQIVDPVLFQEQIRENIEKCQVCDRLRQTEDGEKFWQEMMQTRDPIDEQEFLDNVIIKDILDEGESWTDYKTGISDDLLFFKSDNGAYFFQTAGFEFIWKSKEEDPFYSTPNNEDPEILFQEKKEKKGAITITHEENIITIFKGKADLSTLLHETGHLFLNEMQSVVDIGTASEQFINDNNTIKEWLGFKEGQDSFTTVQQEKFARGFEAYLFEGKAPSKDLESSFERFRKWLLSVYKTVKALNVELNDEIRQVFDRMLVADVEIDLSVQENQMEMPSKQTMDALGIITEDREFMQRLLNQAIFKAEQDLVKDRNKDNRSKRKEWKEKGRELALKRPEYQNIIAMSEGKGLNQQQMEYIYGKDNINKIPKVVPRVVRKDGQNLPEAALDFNYDTVDAMVEDLATVVPVQAFIDTYVQRQQIENDRQFKPNDYLIGTKEYSEFLAIMAKYENRGVTDVAPVKTFKLFAQKLFSDYQIKKSIRTDKYLASLKKYSKIERKKAQQGKFGEAAEANEKVRLNYELSGLSIKQRKKIELLIKRSSRVINSGTIKNEYKQQAVRVIQRFGLTNRNLFIDEDRPTIGEFFSKLTEGVDIEMWEMVPTYSDLFMIDTLETSYKNLTVDQFEELDDLVRYLERRGRRVKEDRLSDGKTLVTEKVVELVQPMRSRKRKKEIFPEDSILEKLTTATRRFFATQESLPFITRRLDGFVGIKGKIGPNEAAINDRLFDADNEFIDLVQDYSGQLNKIAEYFSKRVNDFPKRIIDTGVQVPESMKRGKERFWTYERVVAIALNMGNSQNLQRITGGYLITNTDVNSLTSILNEEDWNNIQKIWDIVNSLWPQLDAAFFRINDFHQKKVEAEEFTAPTGQRLKGGYYPILYDRSLSTKIGEWTEKEDFMNSSEAMFQPANPKNGMLQSRAKGRVELPVKLDLNVLWGHINTSIRYITHSEVVNDVNKIIRSEEYRVAVENAEGQALYEMLRPSLAEIARPNAIRLEHMDTLALREAQRATSYTLGLSRSVALKQPFSIFGFLNDVGDGNAANGVFWYMRGIGKVLVSPFDAYNGMRDASPFMRTRSDNVDRDLKRNIGMIKPGKKSFAGRTWDDVQNSMFMFIRAMDFATVFPSWQGAYQKGMKINNGDMAKAVRYADSQIRNSQPSSQEIDLNHLQRSRKGWHRFFTLFSTFTAKMGARQRYHYNAWRNGSISFARYTSIVTMEQIAPPIMMNLMFALMWGEEPDPEDIALDVITYQFIGIFLVREFAGAVAGIFKGFKRDPFDSPVLIGSKLALKLINDTIQWIEDLDDDEKVERSILALMELLSYGLRTPFPKVVREVEQGIEQYENGDGTAINVLVRNPKIRKRK